jgi:hypothetical protein
VRAGAAAVTADIRHFGRKIKITIGHTKFQRI